MAVEIERKYLIDETKWQNDIKNKGQILKQGYILTDPAKTVRY
jgi:adenylate cyclase